MIWGTCTMRSVQFSRLLTTIYSAACRAGNDLFTSSLRPLLPYMLIHKTVLEKENGKASGKGSQFWMPARIWVRTGVNINYYIHKKLEEDNFSLWVVEDISGGENSRNSLRMRIRYEAWPHGWTEVTWAEVTWVEVTGAEVTWAEVTWVEVI